MMAASGERLRRPDRLVVTIPTNDGLTIALVMFPIAEFETVSYRIVTSWQADRKTGNPIWWLIRRRRAAFCAKSHPSLRVWKNIR
jgi:hypothetical protein